MNAASAVSFPTDGEIGVKESKLRLKSSVCRATLSIKHAHLEPVYSTLTTLVRALFDALQLTAVCRTRGGGAHDRLPERNAFRPALEGLVTIWHGSERSASATRPWRGIGRLRQLARRPHNNIAMRQRMLP